MSIVYLVLAVVTVFGIIRLFEKRNPEAMRRARRVLSTGDLSLLRQESVETNSECPFCSPSDRVLLENDHAFVLLSNPRKVRGHFLAIPKRHVEEPWRLTDAEVADVMWLVRLIQQRLVENFGGGVDVRQNYRPFMIQNRDDKIKVDHVHWHVYPRQLHDELWEKTERYERAMFGPLPDKEAAEMTAIFDI